MLHETFADRFQQLIETLRAQPEVRLLEATLRPPLPEADRIALLAQLPFSLDERFLGYYRVCDGVSLSWVKADAPGLSDDALRERYQQRYTEEYDLGDEQTGHFHLPSLADLIHHSREFEPFYGPGQVTAEVLGGFDGHALFMAMRGFDFDHIGEYDYYRSPLVLHPRFPDPMVIFTSDHLADVSGAHPIRARLYIELMLATAGSHPVRRIFRCFRGYDGDFPPLSFDPQLLIGREYGQPGHLNAVREVAAQAGINVPDYGAQYASMDEDRRRFEASFGAFGVRYTFTGHTNAGGYVQFSVPGDIENLLALEQAMDELRRGVRLWEASEGYREREDYGMSRSIGNLMLSLEPPGDVDRREGYVFYRVEDLPEALQAMLPEAHPARGCLFYNCGKDSLTSAMFRTIPEPPMDDIGPAMALAKAIRLILARSCRMRHLIGSGNQVGFHTAPAEQIEAFLRTQDFRRYDLHAAFEGVVMLSLQAADGTPYAGTAAVQLSGPGRAGVSERIQPEGDSGIFALGRPHPLYNEVTITFAEQTHTLPTSALPAPGEIKTLRA